MKRRRASDPSVWNEPQFSQDRSDRSDRVEKEPALGETQRPFADERQAREDSVWEEPFLRTTRPREERPFARWYQERRERASAWTSWLLVGVLAVVGGVLAVGGAFLSASQVGGAAGVLMLVILGPLSEEMLKVAPILWLVETRPYLIRRSTQIVLCAVGAALGFSIIENLLYLHVYTVGRDLPDLFSLWRWHICTVLHVGASLVASLGVVRVWKSVDRDLVPPDLSKGLPLICLAAAIHGAYNALALMLSFSYLRW